MVLFKPSNTFTKKTGLIERIAARNQYGIANSLNNLQYLEMRWDHAQNLASRHDQRALNLSSSANLFEHFTYDDINQLTDYVVSGDASHSTNVTYTSDGIGNIASKSDVGAYVYHSTKNSCCRSSRWC